MICFRQVKPAFLMEDSVKVCSFGNHAKFTLSIPFLDTEAIFLYFFFVFNKLMLPNKFTDP
jgi:hypothetical protein